MTTDEISDAYERGLLGAERWYAAASRRVELDEVEAFERGELRTAPSCYGRYRDAWPPKRHTGVGTKAPPKKVADTRPPGVGVFRDSPAGAAAGRRRATEILVGGGTRARLHGAAAPRDPEYLDLLWVGSQAKRPRVRVQQTQGCVAAVPFFFPRIAARPLRRVPWGGEGSRKTARKTRRLS